GYRVISLHRASDKEKFVQQASCIMVGGGNTFALLNRIYEHNLLNAIRAKVATGTPYIGWSAGANLACPTLKTTNDMPVVMPPSFEALNLVPFQINPHYHELRFENQGGETRKERLEEFLVLNPQSKVIGLPEGMFIRGDGDKLTVGGEGTAKFYEHDRPVQDLKAGFDIRLVL
ncbi:MAG TPA: dipeptidase PepE, partial [Chryseosolibacter sp.]|nr:dipeptidase PepE [Chryseosolibacter sp.]